MGNNLSSCLNLSISSYISSVLLHNSAESLHIDICTKFRAIKRYFVVTFYILCNNFERNV